MKAVGVITLTIVQLPVGAFDVWRSARWIVEFCFVWWWSFFVWIHMFSFVLCSWLDAQRRPLGLSELRVAVRPRYVLVCDCPVLPSPTRTLCHCPLQNILPRKSARTPR